MKRKHRLQHEVLESRQLLAVNCFPLPSPLDAPAVDDAGVATAAPGLDEDLGDGYLGPPQVVTDFDRDGLPRGPSPTPDFVHDQGEHLFVLDQSDFGGFGSLIIFARRDDGSLQAIEEIEVGFHVDEMIVANNRIVLLRVEPDLGTAASGFLASDSIDDLIRLPAERSPKTVTRVMTVNVDETIEVVHQEFGVALTVLDRDGDRLLMRSAPYPEFVPYIFPPPVQAATLYLFEIAADGMREVASVVDAPLGHAELVGDSVIVAGNRIDPILTFGNSASVVSDGPLERDPYGHLPPTSLPQLPNSVIRQYRISGSRLHQLVEIDLGPGSVADLHLSEDEKAVTVVQLLIEFDEIGHVISGVRHEVELLDFSTGELRHFDTVPTAGYPLATYDDYVLLSENHGELYIVDTNQALDVTAQNRVRRIELPAGLRIGPSLFRGTDDRVALMLDRIRDGGDPMTFGDDIAPRSQDVESVVLSISLADATIIGEVGLDDGVRFAQPRRFTAIDAAKDRLGFLVNLQPETQPEALRFDFGRLGESGQFELEGSIAVGDWLELEANAQRLVVREHDRLVEYRWDDIDNPVQISLLTLTVVDAARDNPFDADGNGTVTARDALVVINFLHRFGTTPIAQLEDRIARMRGAGEPLSRDEAATMRRYDTNASGTITTLDALVVINRLGRERRGGDAAESVFTGIGFVPDDDEVTGTR